MKADEIRQLLHASPFRPFVIHLADGGRWFVKHEDFVALSPNGRTMHVYRHDQPSSYAIVELMLITRLETSDRNGAKKSRR